MRLFLCVVISICYFSCDSPSVWEMKLPDLNEKQIPLANFKGKQASVFIFLSPECPLSESYTLTIQQLADNFPQIPFVAILPGEYYTLEQQQQFSNKYLNGITTLRDPKYQLTHLLGATITPEAYLINSAGNIEYYGKIDDWAITFGKKRTQPTQFYLADAITACLQQEKVDTEHVPAVGCLIEL